MFKRQVLHGPVRDDHLYYTALGSQTNSAHNCDVLTAHVHDFDDNGISGSFTHANDTALSSDGVTAHAHGSVHVDTHARDDAINGFSLSTDDTAFSSTGFTAHDCTHVDNTAFPNGTAHSHAVGPHALAIHDGHTHSSIMHLSLIHI